jgi:tetratricopeptide (TPR) repeat protein
LDDAKREFLEVLRRRPNDPRASFNLGDIYLTTGEAAKAIPYLETAYKSFANEFDIRFALGRAYFMTGNHEKALEHLEAAVKLRPEIPEGFYHLGRTFLKLGRRAEDDAAFKKNRELETKKRFPDGIIEL